MSCPSLLASSSSSSQISTFKKIAGIIKSPVVTTSNLLSATIDAALDEAVETAGESMLSKACRVAMHPIACAGNLTRASIDIVSKYHSADNQWKQSMEQVDAVIDVHESDMYPIARYGYLSVQYLTRKQPPERVKH